MIALGSSKAYGAPLLGEAPFIGRLQYLFRVEKAKDTIKYESDQKHLLLENLSDINFM